MSIAQIGLSILRAIRRPGHMIPGQAEALAGGGLVAVGIAVHRAEVLPAGRAGQIGLEHEVLDVLVEQIGRYRALAPVAAQPNKPTNTMAPIVRLSN